jgi:hypothetical protein
LTALGDRALGDRALQLILALAIGAALAILVNLFGDYVMIGCLAVMALATAVTAPARREEGGGWWALLAIGTIASIAGAGVAQLTETVGGLVAVVGGVLVVVGAVVGFPLRD